MDSKISRISHEEFSRMLADAWEPIKTAPMDGTDILIWAHGALVACWNGYEWADGTGIRPKPTHWMPLPEAPR